MKVVRTALSGCLILEPQVLSDERGHFFESFSLQKFRNATGVLANFVQDNHALSRQEGTVRGLHFQSPPMAQDKLIRCVRGAILDVAVDVRRSSPTYGKHVSAVLSEENWAQLWVPKGFAHGYVTLEPDTEVLYKVTEFYSPAHDRGILWDDPALAIEWGVLQATALLSDKDKMQPKLADIDAGFS